MIYNILIFANLCSDTDLDISLYFEKYLQPIFQKEWKEVLMFFQMFEEITYYLLGWDITAEILMGYQKTVKEKYFFMFKIK
jgi:hypothetical protein